MTNYIFCCRTVCLVGRIVSDSGLWQTCLPDNKFGRSSDWIAGSLTGKLVESLGLISISIRNEIMYTGIYCLVCKLYQQRVSSNMG